VGITAGSREVPGRKGLLQEKIKIIIIIIKILIMGLYCYRINAYTLN
jgi:hypothetical protein